MEEVEILISADHGVGLPGYETPCASGVDLKALTKTPLTLKPLERVLVPTGIRLSIPNGFEAEIRPRSGIAFKHGVTVLNAPGTIDADYRGEVKVLLINLGSEPFVVYNGDRIAQMVFKRVARVRWKVAESLPDSDRGEGGFGSTGINRQP